MFVGGSLFTHKLDNKKAAMKMSTSFLDTQLASLLPSLNDSMTFSLTLLSVCHVIEDPVWRVNTKLMYQQSAYLHVLYLCLLHT